jgi:phage/plasmid-associated DNA primase
MPLNPLASVRSAVRMAMFPWYLLTADTSYHKFVVLEGEGANGKSVFLDVLAALLGEENVAHWICRIKALVQFEP